MLYTVNANTFVICILFAIFSRISGGALIRPSSTQYAANGEGFLAYLELPKSFGAIHQCWYKFRDDPYVLLQLNSTEAQITQRNEVVLPFASNICGIRVNAVSSASAALWTLQAESVHDETVKDSVTISILPAPKVRFDTQVLMEVGKGTIRCTKHDSYTKLCRIFDNTAQQSVWNQCELYTTIRHSNQTFDCLTYNWGRMGESYEKIHVQIKEPTLYTTASVSDNATSIVLRCLYSEITTHSCHAEMPNGKNGLFVMDGLYNGRYSTYDTLSSNSRCSLEIPKPLDSIDIGLWRIMNYDSSTPSGCIFYVGREKKAIIEAEVNKLDTQTQTIQVYRSEGTTDNEIKELYCMVPFVIEDCYLRDPNNTVYFPNLIKFQRYRLFGKCSFDSVPILAGTWLCGARGRDYETEVLQRIDVSVKARGGESLTELVRMKRGSTVELMCRSPFDEPISHCAFINPYGDVFLVGTVNSIKTAGHVQYFGRGIQTGECGIKISELNADDFGQWKCQFVITAGNVKSTFEMKIIEPTTAHASSVGLGVGVSVVVVLLLAVVIGTIFYRRRNLRARHNFVTEENIETSATTETATTQF